MPDPQFHGDWVTVFSNLIILVTLLLKWWRDRRQDKKHEERDLETQEMSTKHTKKVLDEVQKNTEISLTAAAAAAEAVGKPVEEVEQSENAQYLRDALDHYRSQRKLDGDKE